jgi:hypothetical protein
MEIKFSENFIHINIVGIIEEFPMVYESFTINKNIPITYFSDSDELVKHLKNKEYKHEFIKFGNDKYDENKNRMFYCVIKTNYTKICIVCIMYMKAKLHKKYFKDHVWPELVAKVYHTSRYDYWKNYDEED